ncbi:hypothetical protein SPRG_10905 [Saprolegnia parasitica CBS 223.65]|uniref:Uncharacterized protein n=1 Tax=Saprolegnia parasitica (strain CBS 223.65) TaxID=695850 RepID=A0A067CBD3_SAPPC|nr:hypothetical protein SPRG_10905 [Saprolegnia parasitica CBS 223.65]KDO24117.1 hypothetical protein SPRG_10905 [Saprolegnia parasitica CBS 223.65]|eukprot:XP_012205252.1 hypothetical protein SPRG_10905 [Saprolegnia parasitica CBS 223.65]
MATSTTYVNYASPVRMPITERVPLGLRIAQASAGALSCLSLAISLHWSVGFFVAFLAVIMAIANSTAWLLVRYRGRNPPAKPYLLDGLSAAGLLIGGIWLAATEDAAFTVTFMCIGSLLFVTMMVWNKFRPQTKKVTLVVSPKADKDDDEMTHNAYVVLETPGRSLECVI